MNKKNIITAAVSLALVGVMAVGGTLAYLTDNTQTAKNTFVMDSLKLTLKEDAKVLDKQSYQIKKTEDSTYGVEEIVGAEQGIDYIDVLPGATIAKKPYITVTGADDTKNFAAAYVYAYVTNLDEIEAKAISTKFDDAWTEVETDELDGVLLRQKVEKNAENNVLVVFDTVNVNAALTTPVDINDVTIEAFAHQADNASEDEADNAAISYFKGV